jgi:hypothetical protein
MISYAMNHEIKTTNMSAILEQNEFAKISDNRLTLYKWKGGSTVAVVNNNDNNNNHLNSMEKSNC